jgi:hypothetical protein
MRSPTNSIAKALIFAYCLASSLVVAQEPMPIEGNTPLKSVSKRESFVFATTGNGLYRASLETKRWEKLKTPPDMPLDGKFASQPGRSPILLYVALRSTIRGKNEPPRPGLRFGLYLSRDDGMTWELVSERDNFGATLLHPSGVVFAVTGADGVNAGSQLLRSTDLGKTWSDITGKAFGQFQSLKPDPDHPGLIRIRAWAWRDYTVVAEDEKYEWKAHHPGPRVTGRRPSDEFFERSSSSSNRHHLFAATLANYFKYDFENKTQVQALEIVPLKTRFEFARGARVVIPIHVVLHYDPDTVWEDRRRPAADGRPLPKPEPPTEKFADQPGGVDFWGLRVETAEDQIQKYPEGRRRVTMTVESTADGRTVSKTSQPPAAKYEVFNLSPSSPYEREIDLGKLHDFSKPGEYRVQLLYNSGGHPEADRSVWDGSFDSPVFTIIVRE